MSTLLAIMGRMAAYNRQGHHPWDMAMRSKEELKTTAFMTGTWNLPVPPPSPCRAARRLFRGVVFDPCRTRRQGSNLAWTTPGSRNRGDFGRGAS